MHIVASEDLQRNAIFSLDMLEMRLRRSGQGLESVVCKGEVPRFDDSYVSELRRS